jgi:gamma-glutamyltranspeptidase / glutathione hydrolase
MWDAAAAGPHGGAHRSAVRARNGIVASGNWLASLAGVRVLQEGGNAIDAAVTVAATLGVVEPSEAGAGGGGYLLFWEASTGAVRALDYLGKSPWAAECASFTDAEELRIGPKASLVPGALGGWLAALERFGSMDRAHAFRPAIDYAEQGFAVSTIVSGFLASAESDLRRQPRAARIFLPNGRPPRPGEIIVQPELGRTLRDVVEGGADVLYRGPVGKRVAKFLAEHGGLLDERDLADFAPEWLEPLTANWRGLRLYTMPPPSGGLQILQTLKLLEGIDPGQAERFGPDYLHMFIESTKLAIADRMRYLLDPRVPLDELLGDQYAAAQRARIDPLHAAESGEETRQERVIRTLTGGVVAPGSVLDRRDHTTHFDVVDQAGNAVSVTQSVGGFFGSAVVAGDTGLLLNDLMFWFDLEPESPNVVGPNKQLEMPMAPVIASREGRLALAIGTPGGRGILQTTPQMLVNVVDFGQDLQVAVEAPRFRVFSGRHVVMEDRVSADARARLNTRGHLIESAGMWAVPPTSCSLGAGQGVAVDRHTGVLIGAADPRRDSCAIGF